MNGNAEDRVKLEKLIRGTIISAEQANGQMIIQLKMMVKVLIVIELLKKHQERFKLMKTNTMSMSL